MRSWSDLLVLRVVRAAAGELIDAFGAAATVYVIDALPVCRLCSSP